MNIHVTTSINNLSWQKAQDNKISWSDALEYGINFLVAEKEGMDYPDNKLLSRIANLQKLLAEKIEELESLKTPTPVVDAEKGAEEVLKDLGVVKNE
jgi:hypothetical protein